MISHNLSIQTVDVRRIVAILAVAYEQRTGDEICTEKGLRMMRADEFEFLFSNDEEKSISDLGSKVDALLVKSKGEAVLELGAKIDSRVINELVKRYRDDGWHSGLSWDKKKSVYVFTVSHPRLDLVIRVG